MAESKRIAIKKAFVELLEDNPISRITVKDIVGRCGVNRNSFYYHFRDIPSLVEELVMEDADTIIRRFPAVSSIEECLDAAAAFALAHRQTMLHIYQSAERAAFERHLWLVCEYAVCSYIDSAFSGKRICPEDRASIVNYYQCLCFGMAIGWMDGGMREDIRASFRRLCELRRGMAEELICRCAERAEENPPYPICEVKRGSKK